MRWLVALSLLGLGAPGFATAYSSGAPVAYLLDTFSDRPLYEREADKRIPTASMAKMMTAYVTFNALRDKKVSLDQKVKVSPATWTKWNNKGSTMFLRSNESVSINNLLLGVLTLSGNDASVVLAEGVAGSETGFVAEMNAAAKKLGMTNTRFGNPNGWPDGGKTYSTARDLAALAQAIIIEHPEAFERYFSQKSFRWSNVTQANRNPLLGVIEGADGLKTGHSEAAGYCLAGTAKRGDRRLIMIVAGLPTMQSRIAEARKFMNWGFSEWETQTLFRKGETVTKAPVQLGATDSVPLVASWDFAATKRAGSKEKLQLKARYFGPIRAPIRKGEALGELVVLSADGKKQVLPLVAGTSVQQASFLGRAWNGARALVGI
jgi:serine-type D-Ala-D-Ala carboxypeptidase (penicillin-binding protein 5/6)